MKKIGMITIGQSPRVDIVPEIKEILGEEIEVLEAGALDGLSLEQVRGFYPGKGTMSSAPAWPTERRWLSGRSLFCPACRSIFID